MHTGGTTRSFKRWMRNTLHFAGAAMSGGASTSERPGDPRVLLLCGWGLTSGSLSPLAHRLHEDGFQPETLDLGFMNMKAVDEQADRLLEYLVRSPGAETTRVALIGHSLGGIIGRYVVALQGGARYIHTLITLGSPHRGAPLARGAAWSPLRWASSSIAELSPDSSFMKRLREAPIPSEVYCAALFSEGDAFCPRPYAEMEIPPGADNLTNIDVGNYGHFEFVIDETIYGFIRQELLKGLEHSLQDIRS